jgi:hypothetical protein
LVFYAFQEILPKDRADKKTELQEKSDIENSLFQ